MAKMFLVFGLALANSTSAMAQNASIDQDAFIGLGLRWQQNAVYAKCGVHVQPAVVSRLSNVFTVESAFQANDGRACRVRDIFAFEPLPLRSLEKASRATASSMIACESEIGSGFFNQVGCGQ